MKSSDRRSARSAFRSATVIALALAAAGAFSLIAAQSIAADQQSAAKLPKSRDASMAPVAAQADRLSDEALVAHVLNRVAFGPRGGDVERVRRIGVDAYIDEQLYPERIAMPADVEQRIAALDVQRLPAGTLVDAYRTEQRAYQQAQRNKVLAEQGKALEPVANDALTASRREQYRRLALQASEARLVQAIDSPRQLQEVMTDFWYNHFNVFVGKDIDRALVSNYERDAIRPYALGHFRELLGATAKHPAMLFYLDNWLSVAPGYQPRRALGAAGKASGLNENYAREVMELHTLGVDGGYTQQDVTELARMLTGWTLLPQQPKRRRAGRLRAGARGRLDLRLRSAHATTTAPSNGWGTPSRPAARWKASSRSTCWRAIPPPPGTSRSSWRAASSPTSRRPRWSIASRSASSTPTATCAR